MMVPNYGCGIKSDKTVTITEYKTGKEKVVRLEDVSCVYWEDYYDSNSDRYIAKTPFSIISVKGKGYKITDDCYKRIVKEFPNENENDL